MSSCRHNTARRGITLIEVLTTMSVLLMLAVTAAGMLGTITKIGLDTGRSRQTQRSALRLAQQFRRDVAAAGDVQPVDSATGLEILRADRTVRYTWDSQTFTVRRTMERDQQVTAIDRFALSQECAPAFSVAEDRVTVVLKQEPNLWVVEAVR